MQTPETETYSQYSPRCSSGKLSFSHLPYTLLPTSGRGPFAQDKAQQPSECSPAAPHSLQNNVQSLQLPGSTFILLSALGPYLYCPLIPLAPPKNESLEPCLPTHLLFIYILL